MTTLELLKSARAKIAGGWCQRRFIWRRKRKGQIKCFYCLRGAMLYSLPGFVENQDTVLEQDWDAMREAEKIFVRLLPPSKTLYDRDRSYSRLSMWNDIPGRKKPQVLALYDLAIAACQPHRYVPRKS